MALGTIILSSLILLFAYPFVIYPLLLAGWSRRKQRRDESAAFGSEPRVALIICALNEQQVIRDKIENSLALRYPREKLTIVVVSDGSTDRTPDIAREYQHAGVVLVDQKVRRGKIANLNEVIPPRTEEIIVLWDANVMYHADAVTGPGARLTHTTVRSVSPPMLLTDTTPAP